MARAIAYQTLPVELGIQDRMNAGGVTRFDMGSSTAEDQLVLRRKLGIFWDKGLHHCILTGHTTNLRGTHRSRKRPSASKAARVSDVWNLLCRDNQGFIGRSSGTEQA